MVSRKTNEKFYLWCFAPTDVEPHKKSAVKIHPTHFNRYFKSSIVFSYQLQILVIDYDVERYHDSERNSELRDFLSEVGFHCAHSAIFSNITALRHAYIQCQVVLENKDDNRAGIRSFQKYYRSYTLASLCALTPYASLLYPGIDRLLRDNEKYGSELLLCLKAFILEGRNISATARRLFVHRHTVIYRLERISELMGIDFAELDEDSLFHLLLSCELLLHNHAHT
jgi:sugar diacid utilization regulator